MKCVWFLPPLGVIRLLAVSCRLAKLSLVATLAVAMAGIGSPALQAQPFAATPTLTFAPIATQAEGVAPFAVTATSASHGAVTYSVLTGPATISGNMVTVNGMGMVVLQAKQGVSGGYTAATATTSFTVGLPFTLTTATGSTAGRSGTSASVAQGAAANFRLTLMPVAKTVPDAITFTAEGLPAGATATFSPATIAADAAATPVTLRIQTAHAQAAPYMQPISGSLLPPVAVGLLLLPLFRLREARRRLGLGLPVMLLAAGLSLGVVFALSGCASLSGSLPSATLPAAQTYMVVAAATDATTKVQSLMHLTLTVQ
jgi:hypothetical protein